MTGKEKGRGLEEFRKPVKSSNRKKEGNRTRMIELGVDTSESVQGDLLLKGELLALGDAEQQLVVEEQQRRLRGV